MAHSSITANLSPIVVTGGCGFVGFHLVEGLLADDANCEIHVIDLHTERNRVPGVTYHNCDITSPADVDAVFLKAKPKTVFHVASPDPLFLSPSRFRSVNVDGTHNVLAAAQKTTQAFVYTSSSSAIHDNVSELVDADESYPVLRYPAQKRVYTLTKVEAEDKTRAANRQNGDSSMLTVSIRPATAFGARDYGFLGKVIAQARAGKANIQIGSGRNYYDVTYISNLVDAHLLAAHALVNAFNKAPPSTDERVDGEAFIITNDEPVLFWDFHRAVAASVGRPVKTKEIKIIPRWVVMLMATISEWTAWLLSFGKEQPPITREAVHLSTITRTFKCDKAKRILGYNPKVGIYEGLEIASKWFLEEQGTIEGAKKTA